MSDNTHKSGSGRRQKIATYSASEVLAWNPSTRHWELFRKIPYTKQAYESKDSPGIFVTMEWLINEAVKNREYLPVVRPVFVTRKYRTCTGESTDTSAEIEQ